MSFLNNDLVNEVKEKFGAEAESVVEEKTEGFVGKDIADAVVGAAGSALGIQQGDATPDASTNDTQPADASTQPSSN